MGKGTETYVVGCTPGRGEVGNGDAGETRGHGRVVTVQASQPTSFPLQFPWICHHHHTSFPGASALPPPTMSLLNPLITICGTTGVGKSKLAIDLALHLAKKQFGPHGWRGARIINADSMQVYNGLDVITNKVPPAEMEGVEHLLMGFKNPGEQYVVGEWVEDSLKLVSRLMAMLSCTQVLIDVCRRSMKCTTGKRSLSSWGALRTGFNISFSPTACRNLTSHLPLSTCLGIPSYRKPSIHCLKRFIHYSRTSRKNHLLQRQTLMLHFSYTRSFSTSTRRSVNDGTGRTRERSFTV